VLFANCGANADSPHASERMGSNIGTVRVVAEIFSELFFTAVRSHHARLNRDLRNRESPNQMFGLSRIIIGKRLSGKQAPIMPHRRLPISRRAAFLSRASVSGCACELKVASFITLCGHAFCWKASLASQQKNRRIADISRSAGVIS